MGLLCQAKCGRNQRRSLVGYLVVIVVFLSLLNNCQGQDWWDDGKSLEITDENMWKTIGSKTQQNHHVVEFFGERCGYCRTFKPDWDRLAEEFNNKTDIVISSINSTKYRPIAKKFGISAYPTLVYFVPGKSMYKYSFEDKRNYENVRKWILECREKEEGASRT